ncbi:MAG: phytoene/squalene synthase family protein [Candidatus Aminicenantes bacterium]|nr:phytoene/squalene synthase family protein [Candidatus Aminicenantes bacterium]
MSRAERVRSRIFRRGSRTYFNSTRFFPAPVRRDVRALYAFVRTADDLVDGTPQDGAGFEAFRREYLRRRGGPSGPAGPVIDAFVELSGRRGFDPAWVDAFLESMAWDLSGRAYRSLEETLAYVYGSAEVIGLMMAGIMGLDERGSRPARLLGRAMQYINFIRDIQEDLDLGRTYLPGDEIRAAGLGSLREDEARRAPDAFRGFVRDQIGRYRGWRAEAEAGFALMPSRFRVPVRTAADMYDWTAARIEAEPFVVYGGKVRPSRRRIVLRGIRNILRSGDGDR